MLSRIAPLALLSAYAIAQSPVIYDNGPLKTGVNGLNDLSLLQSNPNPLYLNVLGYGHNIAGNVSWCDQFTVANVLIVDEIEVYGYLTNAVVNGCTGIQIALYDGNPSTGTPMQLLTGAGMVASGGTQLPVSVAGTVTGNYTCSTGWAEATAGVPLYRAAAGTPASTARRVQKVNVKLATPLVLSAGTYYLHYGTVGLSFCPPRTTLKQLQTGGTSDCIQLITATWGPIVDTGFRGNYTSIAATATDITVAAASWIPNELVGKTVSVTAGVGSPATNIVVSNTATTIVVANAWVTPPTASTFSINPYYSPGVPQGMPFKLMGSAGTLGSITNYGGAGGGVTATLNVDGAPVVGGYVRADLTGVNPAAFGLIIASSNFPTVGGPGPVPLACGATWNVEPDFQFVGTLPGQSVSMNSQIPVNAGLQGANLRFQGAEVDPFFAAGLTCDLGGGFQFSMTNAFNYVLNTN